MVTDFTKSLNVARRRSAVNRLLDVLGAVLTVVGAALAVALACERAMALSLVTGQAAAIAAGVVAVVLAAAWLLRRPTPAHTAIEIDERLALRERFSTALALASSTDPFAVAAREDAYARAKNLPVAKHFPIELGRRWFVTGSCWAVAGLVALLMPHMDLLGRQADAARLAKEDEKTRQAAADIKRTATKVETIVKQLDTPELAEELQRLADIRPDMASADMRREAIRKMGEVSDKLQEMAGGERGDTARMLQEMMKQLRMPSQGLSKQLAQNLSRGKYKEAMAALKDLQDKMARNEMTPQEREALAKDFESLARQLEAMAKRKKELEDELAKAGVDKNLAGQPVENLRKALQNAGLDSKTIEKLLQKQQACQNAGNRAAAMAQAMSACAGQGMPGGSLSPEAMASLGDQLSDLEAMRQQLAMTQAAMDELYAAMTGLGEGLGGGIGQFAPGLANQRGMGAGGPGQGNAPMETGPPEATGSQGTRVQNPNKTGPIIATWYTQEEQVAGESKRDLQQTIEAAKDRAAEAVSENTIPSRYHESVKRYFETVGKPDAPKGNP